MDGLTGRVCPNDALFGTPLTGSALAARVPQLKEMIGL